MRWIMLALGVAMLLEGSAFLYRRRRTGRRSGLAGDLMLCSIGAAYLTGNAAELRGWKGAGLDAVDAVSAAAVLCAVAFSVRSLTVRNRTKRGPTS
ncbi:hypothetical protein [Actinospica robiniae]|uniref:hypothetical protein n=1 Tax=Actinospica robiniae TaxID=304901 RepID=UPI0012FAEE90|nr:hypothetical protein [Actinospica robiniae]